MTAYVAKTTEKMIFLFLPEKFAIIRLQRMKPVPYEGATSMKGETMKKFLSLVLSAAMALSTVSTMAFADEAKKYTTETTADGWVRVVNEDGATLGYYPETGVTLIEKDGYAFKDMNKNGELDLYEDWRASYEDRAHDLVSKMSVEEMSGLRLNGAIGSLDTDIEKANDMGGNPLYPQIVEDGMRYFIMYPIAFGAPLIAAVPAANALQKTAEATALGIPMMLNCDPTTTMTGTVTNMALGATFSPEKVAKLSTDVAKLYRAAGITMTLSPQVDLESDPRSQSVNTFTEDPALAAALANAMISAYQSTYAEDGTDLGWGKESLAVQFKHFFGNLANEGGRNYHDFTGKYTVMTEEDIETQLVPFVQGGFKLDSKTGAASAIMVTYTVPCDEEGEAYGKEAVGGAFNDFVMGKLKENGFEGMVSTDSLIFETLDLGYMVMLQTAYNVNDMETDEKIYVMFNLGVDQIMGSCSAADLAAGYKLYVEEEGEEAALKNWQEATYDCVLPIFRVGNFDNPYVVTSESAAIFEQYTPEATNELAQSSIVMLKNDGVIMKREEKAKVYIVSSGEELPVGKKVLKSYFDVVDKAEDADFALVLVDSPRCVNTGYNNEDEEWVPITLQYRPYTADADCVEEDSITGDVTVETSNSPYGAVNKTVVENRGYYDAKNTVSNEADLDLILDTAALGKPVVVCLNASGAFCVDEFEDKVAAILVGFGVDKSNYLAIAAGQVEPSALLPLAMPKNMEAVEAQASGTPHDMECYVDAAGNKYDFGFGLNWSGVIEDERTKTFDGTLKMAEEVEEKEAEETKEAAETTAAE